MRPACRLRNPENVLGEILLGILRVGQLVGEQLGPLGLEGVGDVLEEDQAEGDMLVIGRLHVAAQLVCRRPELRLEPEIGAVVVRLLCHVVLDRYFRMETQFAQSAP